MAAACLALCALRMSHRVCAGKSEEWNWWWWWRSPAQYALCILATLFLPPSTAPYLLALHRLTRYNLLLFNFTMVIESTAKFIGYIICEAERFTHTIKHLGFKHVLCVRYTLYCGEHPGRGGHLFRGVGVGI